MNSFFEIHIQSFIFHVEIFINLTHSRFLYARTFCIVLSVILFVIIQCCDRLCLFLIFPRDGILDQSTAYLCSHLFSVQFSWQCSPSSMITWPIRLILSIYSEIGNGLATNCRLFAILCGLISNLLCRLDFSVSFRSDPCTSALLSEAS